MRKINFKYISVALLAVIPNLIWAQDAATAVVENNNTSSELVNLNVALAVAAFALMFIIYMLTTIFDTSVKLYKSKNSGDSATPKTMAIILGLLLVGATAAHAETPATKDFIYSTSTMITALLSLLIITEFIIVLYLLRMIKHFTGLKEFGDALAEKEASPFMKWWNKSNNFIPLEQESNLDSGHNYDGIRELDNKIPGWFSAAFIFTVFFACLYMWQFEINKSIPTQEEELAAEMKIAEADKLASLKSQANTVDENNVVMLGEADIQAGALLYKNNCVSCHKDKGQGDVGPNLTDNYWLHKGGIADVFKSIKYGIPDKGMKSWEGDFSAQQLAQLASFVKSLKGTNPAGGKEPQGDLYEESVVKDTATVAKDTITIKK